MLLPTWSAGVECHYFVNEAIKQAVCEFHTSHPISTQSSIGRGGGGFIIYRRGKCRWQSRMIMPLGGAISVSLYTPAASVSKVINIVDVWRTHSVLTEQRRRGSWWCVFKQQVHELSDTSTSHGVKEGGSGVQQPITSLVSPPVTRRQFLITIDFTVSWWTSQNEGLLIFKV